MTTTFVGKLALIAPSPGPLCAYQAPVNALRSVSGGHLWTSVQASISQEVPFDPIGEKVALIAMERIN
jgi:hypothetical protein